VAARVRDGQSHSGEEEDDESGKSAAESGWDMQPEEKIWEWVVLVS